MPSDDSRFEYDPEAEDELARSLWRVIPAPDESGESEAEEPT